MENFAARATATTVPITPITRAELKAWTAKQSKSTKAWVKAREYDAKANNVLVVPGRDGSIGRVLIGVGSEGIGPWTIARLPAMLPKGSYALERVDGNKSVPLTAAEADAAALGWGLGAYDFTRYLAKPKKLGAKLVWPDACNRDAVTAALEATAMVRDLINTPASDMGPRDLVDAGVELAGRHGAEVSVLEGDELLEHNYPAVHAVGRGSERAPCLVDIRWGDPKAPKVSLVGKGVVFDSGGLDLKSAGGMKLMKKDMGGGAHVLALAHMIMSAKLPVRLRVLVPAVENGVAGDAMRPLDVLSTRKGISVEVGNTDAEGRLILCDALAEADSEKPDLLVDFATLTGAARVAVGTELAAMFTDDEALAAELYAAGEAESNPMWRLPLYTPYRRFLDSRVADINNISSVGQGGAITAALFLKEFVSSKTSWVHFDVMGWNAQTRPGRPVGGEAMGLRATFAVIAARYPATAE